MGMIFISVGILQSTEENIGCTWEHLEVLPTCLEGLQISMGMPITILGVLVKILQAPWITTELSQKNNICFRNTAGTPGNHSYYLSSNDFSNSWIQFVFSSMYLYSYPSTHNASGLAAGGIWQEFKVCLTTTIEWTDIFTLKLRSSVIEEALRGHAHVNYKDRIEGPGRYTWRLWSCKVADVLGSCDPASLEICTLEAMMVLSWRPWLCKLGGYSQVILEMNVEVMIVQSSRCKISELYDTLGGRNCARVDEYLKSVHVRRAGCWNCFHLLVDSQPWECDGENFLLSYHRGVADGSQSRREIHWKWKQHSGVNS